MCIPLLLLDTSLADTTGVGDDLHENKPVAIIILLIVVGLAIWKAWPSLMANNVFSKKRVYNYGRGEELLQKKSTAAINLLGLSFMAAYGGICLLIYKVLYPPTFSISYVRAHRQIDPEALFLLSLIGIVAAFVYLFVDEKRLARVLNIKYTFKIWLTTIPTSALVLMLMDHRRIVNVKWFLNVYFNTIILSHGIGITTLTVLLFAAHHLTAQPWKAAKKRLYILLTAETALLLNMFVLALCMGSGMGWLLEVLPYTVIMAICIWFYPMDNTVYSDVIEAEVIE